MRFERSQGRQWFGRSGDHSSRTVEFALYMVEEGAAEAGAAEEGTSHPFPSLRFACDETGKKQR